MESLMLKVNVTSKNNLVEKQNDSSSFATLLEVSVKTPFSSQVASISIKWAYIHLSTDQTHHGTSGDGFPFNCYCNECYLKINALHLKKHLCPLSPLFFNIGYCLISRGCCNKVPQTQCLKTIYICQKTKQ